MNPSWIHLGGLFPTCLLQAGTESLIKSGFSACPPQRATHALAGALKT